LDDLECQYCNKNSIGCSAFFPATAGFSCIEWLLDCSIPMVQSLVTRGRWTTCNTTERWYWKKRASYSDRAKSSFPTLSWKMKDSWRAFARRRISTFTNNSVAAKSCPERCVRAFC